MVEKAEDRADGRADHRIGDVERQQAIDVLRAHTTAGRLTLDEFSDLAGDVYAAQTYGELEAVGRKLPPGLLPEGGAAAQAPAPPVTPPPGADRGGTARGDAPPVDAASPGWAPPGPGAGPAAGPVDATPVDAAPAGVAGPSSDAGRRRTVIAVMCGTHPRGRWRPAARLTSVAFWGGAHIDLRDAEFPGPVIDICAWSIMGGLTVTVPEGTRVELDGPVIMGGADDHTTRTGQAPPPDAPLVRVHARVFCGGLGIRNPSRKARLKRALAEEARRMAEDARANADQATHHRHRVLELPQRILDDLDWLLADRRHGPEPARDRGQARSRPGRPPGPPWPPHVPQPPRPPWHARSEDEAPPQDEAPTPPTGTLTMMVTDVADSTRLAEKLGDRRWIGVMGEHNALVREQVARHGGTEVKALGDGFLVVYPSARRAILSAVDVQRALARFREERPDTPVAVRIGLHTGEIVDVDGDVLGQNVVVAARLADQAEPGEIVVSGLTRDLTVAGGDLTFGPPDEVELKGLSERWRIHRVSWAPTAPAAPAP